jgi:hypothetical protein
MFTMLGGIPVTTVWFPAMEISCENIQQTATDKRQGVLLQFAGWV